MAISTSAAQLAAFQPQDYSRFLIREFLKKQGFNKTYDAFMVEDMRPKVTMTKIELTRLLNLNELNKRNQKTKQFETMLDMCCNYFLQTKLANQFVDIPSLGSNPSQQVSATKMSTASTITNMNPDSSSSSYFKQPALNQNRAKAIPSSIPASNSNMSKTSASGFYKQSAVSSTSIHGNNQKSQPSGGIVNTTGLNNNFSSAYLREDDDAYEWDQHSPNRKETKKASGMVNTANNFYKPQNDTKNLTGSDSVSSINQQPPVKKNQYVQKKMTTAADDELEDWDDNFELKTKNQPIKTNQNMAWGSKKTQKKERESLDDDPLSFLKKADEERKAIANRQIEQTNQITKTLEELHFNPGQYQGNDFDSYDNKQMCGQTTNITTEQCAGLKTLLFRSQTGSFHDSWCQGFFFDEKIKYGIFQNKGGPCGILATVNAFFLKHLLFVQQQRLNEVTSQMQKDYIASALTDIMLNSAENSSNVILAVPKAQPRPGVPISPSLCQLIKLPVSRNPILQTFLSTINYFTQSNGQGVILLVYSVILTHGCDQVTENMDLAENCLINEHGYASQELLNIMLVGKSASNVHNGDKDMGEGFILKGIPDQSEIGFLTFYEHFGYFQVGSFLKLPPLPIWIICSESHYSVMFSCDKECQTKKKFDLVYYDELARAEDDIILTIIPGGYKPASTKEYTVPIDSVIRTRWDKASVDWNGRTVIL